MTITTDLHISNPITFGQLKKKFETKTMTTNEILSQELPELSIMKVLRTSKVKGMASLFNSKIAQQNADTGKDQRQAINSQQGSYTDFLIKNKLQTRAKSKQTQKPIPKPRIETLFNVPPNNKTPGVPEDKFVKLTVKDKVSLYNQFVSEMSQRNPKFIKHAEQIETKANKVNQKNGVVNEKQAPVKQILAQLEAKCTLPRQTLNPLAMQKVRGLNNKEEKLIKSKEFEDASIMQNSMNHITSLTVRLKPIHRAGVSKVQRSKSLPRYINENENASEPKEELETNNKRSNEKMRYCSPFEVYAPPRKIRRTRTERLSPKIFFQSEQLEILFLSWLNGKEQQQTDETRQTAEVSNVDQLLEETLNKLEGIDTEQKEELVKPNNDKTETAHTRPESPTTCVKSQDYKEYESGLSSLPKISSDESQNENPLKKNDKDFELCKPKAQRKKKLRRTVEETNPISNSNSTDSDMELKKAELKSKSKLLFLPNTAPTNATDDKDMATQPSSEEINDQLIREVNSSGKIKSVYTLTACSLSSSPTLSPEEKETKRTNIKLDIAQSLPISQQASSSDISKLNTSNMIDSFIDQGFETGSNEMESPARIIKLSINDPENVKKSEPLFFKLSPTTPEASSNINPFDFSTPLKDQPTFQFNNSPAQQQPCSPITKSVKSRRRSLYDNEGRRSSVTMQVIREDQPLEQHELTVSGSLNKTATNAANRINIKGFEGRRKSQFWIKCGDFTLCFDILYNEFERLRLLYEIFSQKSYDNQDLHFGVDNFKFSLEHAFDRENVSKRLPKTQEFSHFWISTGDLAIPFVGRRLSGQRIQSIFELLKVAVKQTGILHFGVDAIDFSITPEFSSQSPKFSMDSNYSMLVGLQSGTSNGLEGRSKYAWPNTKPARASDIEHSDVFCEDSGETDSGGLSSSPFGSKQFDLPSSSPIEQRVSNISLRNNRESFGFGYENEALDNLFPDSQKLNSLRQKPTAAVPQFNAVKTQQEHFNLLQGQLSAFNNQDKNSPDNITTPKETPEFIEQLNANVAEIINKGSRSGFRNCTVQELENYMSILSRYASMCLENCNGSLEKVLNALLDQRAVLV